MLYSTLDNYGLIKSQKDVWISGAEQAKERLPQRGVLDPIHFKIVMDDVIKDAKRKVKALGIGSRNMEVVSTTACVFADDSTIFASNEKDLQSNLEA